MAQVFARPVKGLGVKSAHVWMSALNNSLLRYLISWDTNGSEIYKFILGASDLMLDHLGVSLLAPQFWDVADKTAYYHWHYED